MPATTDITLDFGEILPPEQWSEHWGAELEDIDYQTEDLDGFSNYFLAPVKFVIGDADLSPPHPVSVFSLAFGLADNLESRWERNDGTLIACIWAMPAHYEFFRNGEEVDVYWDYDDPEVEDMKFGGTVDRSTIESTLVAFMQSVFDRLSSDYPDLANNPGYTKLQQRSLEIVNKYNP